MAVQMTQEQLDQLIQALRPAGPTAGAGAAAIVGRLGPCELGRDKLKRYKRFTDWVGEAESKMRLLGIADSQQKASFVQSSGGVELNTFWEKEARIRWVASTDPQLPAHTYQEIIDESKSALLKYVSRDRAIIDLLHMPQGDKSVTEFVAQVEDQAALCRVGEIAITEDDLKRLALIAGFKDRSLAEKCLGEEYNLRQVIATAVTRESSKANAEAVKVQEASSVKQVNTEEGDWLGKLTKLQGDMETVMRLQQRGKYSGMTKRTCNKCTFEHERDGKCPAVGRECRRCGQEGHFSRSSLCKGKGQASSTRRVEDSDLPQDYDEANYSSEEETVKRVEEEDKSSTVWPGVSNNSKTSHVRKVNSGGDRWVELTMGKSRMKLYADTGSRFTIITPAQYRKSMGKVVAADTRLRAWGSKTYLDVKGMFLTRLTMDKGASTGAWVYVVDGYRPEALLGDKDAEDLGIFTFHKEGREEAQVQLLVSDLRAGGIKVDTGRETGAQATMKERGLTMAVVDKFKGTAISDRIGKVRVKPVKLEYEHGFRPVQPPRFTVPYHYQDRLSKHLQKLREDGVIEDVDPREPIDCILNIALSEKKNKDLRMNIDARPLNKGAKMTRYHITTPQEVRHQISGANFYTEMDMGHGFHQVPLDPETSRLSVFQTHEGLHRMKRLYFGPMSATGIFHHTISQQFAGVPGCISIHDNVLVYGSTVEEHNRNLEMTLTRAAERGITFKLSKSTFCLPEVRWFGRVFSSTGMSADPDKINHIITAGRPNSLEDVRSFLQAASFNARYAFDHKESCSYEEVTKPLRELLVKDSTFHWTGKREQAYQTILRMMSDRTTLRPFSMDKPTHFVSDASPAGISASLYQEEKDGRWVPVDHASRALSAAEQRWKSQIDWESLGKSWGMTQFRHYLVGRHFNSWGDHEPLLAYYNDLTKPGSVRLNKHRQLIQDLSFTDKYLPGKKNPADYSSRHPHSIEHLTQDQREEAGVDDGEEVHIMRILVSDLPEALTLDHIKEAASLDPIYQKLVTAIRQGKKEQDQELRPYHNVWGELSLVDGLVCRGERIVIPDAELVRDGGNIRDWVVDLGHDGCPGITVAKRLIRTRLWFPGMDDRVERRVGGCLECQASTKVNRRDPLKPTPPPEEPWQELAADHWGPTQDGKYLLVVVDRLTRYPEVEIVAGTSGEDNVAALDSILARHGNPAVLITDNGAPFNGGHDHILQKYLRQEGIRHKPTESAEDPEANGLAEAFMKHCKKVWHTAIIGNKDPKMQLQKHLKMFRATPHPTTGKSPAELLFARRFRTKLPDIRTNPDREDIQQAREQDRKEKARQKMYKDNKSNVRPHNIKEGDTILLERKTTKANSPYDPRPYTAEAVHGTQIVGKRGEERKVRDSQKWKKVEIRPVQRFSRTSQETREEDPDIGLPVTYQTGPGEARQQHQAEGAERGQPPADGEGVDRQRPVSRERWSFSPPRNWIERPSRPLTRSVAARRQRERVGHRKGAE